MYKVYFGLGILFLLSACGPTQVAPTISIENEILQSKEWNVAVIDLNYEFEESGLEGAVYVKSAGADGGKVVAGVLASELANIDKIQIVERSQMDDVLAEQSIQMTGAIDTETVVKIGQLIGVDAIIVGNLTDYVSWNAVAVYGSTITFSVRMIDTESGRVVLSGAISRVRSGMEPFPNVQVTTKELVDSIRKRF